MKKIRYVLIALLLALTTGIMAQGPSDQRAFNTKIADVLALMPAPNKTQFNTNMEAIAALGEEGLSTIAGMMVAPGKGDNTQLEYAISGYTYYVTQPGKENARKQAVSALCKALSKSTVPEIKDFLISQIQTVGDNSAVATLQPYLVDSRLCDPAARTLVKINTPDAKTALLNALSSASPDNKILLTEAIGDCKYTPAVATIAGFATSSDKKLAKVALYALSEIADPSSATVLAAAAAKSGYVYEVTNATSSYLNYAAALNDKDAAAKIAQELLGKATAPTQVHTRTAALKLLTSIKGEQSMPLLLAAANDKQQAYRDAALKFAGQYALANNPAWLKKLTGADNDDKAAVIDMLGNNKVAAALPAVLKLLASKNETVKLAAIKAAGQIGGTSALASLLATMKSGDANTIEAVKNALLIMPGDDVATQSGAALATMPAAAQTALLSVLAARKADNRVNDVLALTNNSDATVRTAAISALKDVAAKGSLSSLFSLLNNSTSSADIANIQSAIINSGAGGDEIMAQLGQVSADKKKLYLPILAGIGGQTALSAVEAGYKSGDADTKKAAVTALAAWKNTDAAASLLQIARDNSGANLRDEAVAGYVALARKSSFPAEQKLLMLRNAMELTSTPALQEKILQGVEQCKTLPALLFAADYLNSNAQQAAATAVMNIALADKSYNGEIVRKVLENAATALKGRDADYQRQAIKKYLGEMPAGEGFVTMFNGKNLDGWKGLVENPVARGKMDAKTLAKAQQKADETMKTGWSVKDGLLVFNGHGDNLCTEKKYGDFEMLVDWKITAQGDAGIYLRGSPQVQIWDTSRRDVGAQVGSGGLYNNQQHESKPLKLADNAIGEWNHFRIIMKGDRVTVYLNGELVTDNTILENYWDRGLPIFPEEQIELQAHGTYVAYRDLYIKEIPRPKPFVLSDEEKKAGYKVLFDGTNMHEWVGNTKDYVIDNGDLVIFPTNGGHGNLYTKDEYKNFSFRFEFQLTPGANNGLGIRAPLEGDAAYVGMELQILDNEADIYKDLNVYQYHGSVYGVIPAKRGFLKPVGEWNVEEAIVNGTRIKVILNGTVILDGDIADARKNGTLDHKDHPGLKNETGHIGFLGHGSIVRFRNIRVKTL
ncbi:DUF1080 domain-containing protein [Chitinophaga silvatica]|uniref:DUF1080 domain-containing protein n=1 Tax=Chitinophaga silvatica TaxID=2282649 RepID=A0A3E1Y9C7_9BACT|nr:family 16 glycoside hydrolase [Chitinophaga silvatica]RFS22003.1 DUF1080 domain-containing protein [Chitinophaga silvatica]